MEKKTQWAINGRCLPDIVKNKGAAAVRLMLPDQSKGKVMFRKRLYESSCGSKFKSQCVFLFVCELRNLPVYLCVCVEYTAYACWLMSELWAW